MRIREGAVGERSSSRYLPAGWLIAAAALLAASVIGATYEAYREQHPRTYQDLVKWVDIEVASETARKNDLPILYYFTAEWCGPCKRLSKEVFSVEKYARVLNGEVVPVRVDEADAGKASKAVRKRFKIKAYPTFVLTGSGVKEFKKQEGFMRGPDLVLWLGRGAKK